MQIIAIIGVAASLGTAIHLHKPVSVVTVPVPVMPSGPASSHLSPPAVSDPIPVPRPFPSTAVAADRNRSVAAAPRSAGSRLAPPKGGPGDPDATHPAPKVSGIAGSHLLELSPEALRKLGLGVDSLGVVSCWLEEGQLFEWRITSSGIQMGDNRLSDIDPPAIRPTIVTDDVGGMRATIYDDGPTDSTVAALLADPATRLDGAEELREHAQQLRKAALRNMMYAGRLVPVLVRTGRQFTLEDSVVRRHFRPDCIFWYEPTPELLAALPADVRGQVERELRVASQIVERAREGAAPEASATPPSSTSASTGDRPYVDLLRSASGAIASSSVVPNPAADRALLSYTLSRPRSVSIALHDVSGRLVRKLATAESHGAGESATALDLGGLSKGIYLITLTTDGGEQAVQRLIINR